MKVSYAPPDQVVSHARRHCRHSTGLHGAHRAGGCRTARSSEVYLRGEGNTSCTYMWSAVSRAHVLCSCSCIMIIVPLTPFPMAITQSITLRPHSESWPLSPTHATAFTIAIADRQTNSIATSSHGNVAKHESLYTSDLLSTPAAHAVELRSCTAFIPCSQHMVMKISCASAKSGGTSACSSMSLLPAPLLSQRPD